MRIASLLPSATDIVVALGAGDELVGVSHSCGTTWSHLPALTSTRLDLAAPSATIDAEVKGTGAPLYDLDIARLEQLAPDVVISQSLCDVCAVPSGDVEDAVCNLPSRPLLVNLMPFGLNDIPDGFRDVGAAIKRENEAVKLIDSWENTFDRLHGRFAQSNPLRVAFLDWLMPPFAAGHWMPDLIGLLGCNSVLAQPGDPSYEVSWSDVRRAEADVIIAACCGFTAMRADQDPVPADLTIHLLDGDEHFSRPSPRLLDSVEVLIDLLDDVITGSKQVGAVKS